VPERAAIHEAVSQAKALGHEALSGMVNGTLREVVRKGGAIFFPDRVRDPVGHLSVVHAYPTWLVSRWIRQWGTARAEALMEAGNQSPRLVLRVNRLRTSREEVMGDLEAQGVKVAPSPYAPDAIRVSSHRGPVTRLKGFQEGRFSVQGEAAQAAVRLLGPQPGERILDVCAGLGGKSTYLAELMGDRGVVVALDKDVRRLRELRRGAGRLGIHSLRPVAARADRQMPLQQTRPFDKIVVDVPCSGLGVVSKHPDGKWVRNEKDIPRLAQLQARILGQASRFLCPGGMLLYLTCTLTPEENEYVVEGLLRAGKEWALVDLKKTAPPCAADLVDAQGFFRAYPDRHGTEGFFGALIRRVC